MIIIAYPERFLYKIPPLKDKGKKHVQGVAGASPGLKMDKLL